MNLAILGELFWSFFQIGAFSFGGGLAALPLIQHNIVEVHGWLTLTDFANVVTISEMTPGPIAINAATFVGLQVAGMPGAIIATVGCVVPACVIVTTIAYFFFKYKNLNAVQWILDGLRPATVALILSAGLGLFTLSVLQIERLTPVLIPKINVDYIAAFIFAGAFLVLRKFHVKPIAVMVSSGVVGLALYTFL